MRPGQLVGERARAIRRIVVDDDELEIDRRLRGDEHRVDQFGETVALVVRRERSKRPAGW